MSDVGTTVKVEAGYAIYSKFLDRWFTAETRIKQGETRADAVIRLEKELNEIADTIRSQAAPKIDDGPNVQTAPFAPTSIPEPPVINIQDEKMEIEIDNCETVEQLMEWKKKNEVLTGKILSYYVRRLNELRPVEY